MKTVGQLFVVKAKQMQDRGIEVVNMDFVRGGVESEIVGFAERDAGLDATNSPSRC